MLGTSGAVVIVNGASSAGKSSLSAAFARRLAARGVPITETGWDQFVPLSVPVEMIDFTAGLEVVPEVFERTGYPVEAGALADLGVRYVADGPAGGRLDCGPAVEVAERAMHVGVAALARSGSHVLVDELCRSEELFGHWNEMLDGLDVAWVGLRCGEDALRDRERRRGDRLPGLSAWSDALVHGTVRYDLELDSSGTDAETLAERLDDWLDERWPGRLHP